ncbi:MAG TPA: hypothetical protein VNO52_13085 [Methylomirabilota bacterium]|nr:hypothetical protein [Methylomirabilota bacterium]
MTFIFKLCRRLAASHRTRMLVGLALASGCASEDRPALTDPVSADTAVLSVTVLPDSIQLLTTDSVRLVAFGRSNSSDSVPVALDWTSSGGVVSRDGVFRSAVPGVYRIVGRARNASGASDTVRAVVLEPTAPPPPGVTVTGIRVSPDSVSLAAGQSATFSAVSLMSDGTTWPASVTWSASGGTISSAGVYSAGAAVGAFRVIASDAAGRRDSAVVVVTAAPPSSSGAYPNQPAGFRRIAEHAFGSRSLGATALAGQWSDPTSGAYTAQTAPGAPLSPSGVLQVKWPAGLPAGVSPGKFTAWDRLDLRQATRYHELYISMRVRVLGTDFENQSVGTKLWYVGYGNTRHTNDGFIYLQGVGRQAKLPAMRILAQMSSQDVGSSTPYPQNVTSAPLFTVGSWHHVEVYLKTGTVGRRDGVVRIWVDGVKVTDYTTVQFLDPVNNYTEGFFHFQWTPVWGGNNGDRRTRDDFMQLDHLYIAGK